MEVCDLHFAAQVTPNNTSTSIPDKVGEIYSGPQPSGGAGTTPATTLVDQLEGLTGNINQLMIARPTVPKAHPGTALPCESQQKDLEKTINAWKDKNKAFTTALNHYKSSHIPQIFNDISTGGLSLQTINARLDELKQLEPVPALISRCLTVSCAARSKPQNRHKLSSEH